MSAYKNLTVQEQETDKSKDNLNALLAKCRNTSFPKFWDIITMGGSERHGKKLGVLSYEHMLQETLEQTKFLMVLKAVAAGITFFCIMWSLWKIMRNDDLQNSQMAIVEGPSINLANTFWIVS